MESGPLEEGKVGRVLAVEVHGIFENYRRIAHETGAPDDIVRGRVQHEGMDDEEVAAVLTFVRNSWGNQGTAVTPNEVQKARATL